MGTAMASWHCDQAAHGGQTYCKRHVLMQKMRALPPDGGSPERKAVMTELVELMKGKSADFVDQSKAAKKAYCEQPAKVEIPYCKMEMRIPTSRVPGAKPAGGAKPATGAKLTAGAKPTSEPAASA